jgi:hypothetical protein
LVCRPTMMSWGDTTILTGSTSTQRSCRSNVVNEQFN